MPSDVRFADLRRLLERAGWTLDRVNGSHHIFTKDGRRPISVPVHKGKVKAVYDRQVREALQEEDRGEG